MPSQNELGTLIVRREKVPFCNCRTVYPKDNVTVPIKTNFNQHPYMFVLLRVRPAHHLSMIRQLSTSSVGSVALARFRPSRLDNVECVEDYQRHGLHPVAIGDLLGQGRYRIVHKLGFGGSSTIWLARNRTGKLMTLKVMRADMSSKSVDEIPEVAIPKKVLEYIRARHPVPRSNIQTIEDYFVEHGPNGSHFCLVSHFAGPSILSMSDSPGRVIGSRRLRRDLARKVAKQLTEAVEFIHSAGFVHGDLTTSNILFRVAENIQNWSDSDVYINFGQPVTDEVVSCDQSPLGPSSPARLVAPIDLTNSTFLQEDTLLIDFGQSFPSLHPPSDYEPATVPHYQSPEARFEGRIDMSSDIWALACTIFEICAGFPLFEAFFGGSDEILKEVVATLGKLPEPWWGAFENHHRWFEEDGMPKGREFQRVLLPAEKTSIKHQLTSIGSQDLSPATGNDGPMMERPGTRLDEVEIQLLGNLLEKMLRYRPQDRIEISEVVSHPWFTLE